PWEAGGRHRAGVHLDGLLHPGEHQSEDRPDDHLGCRDASVQGRCRGDQAPEEAVSQAVGASGWGGVAASAAMGWPGPAVARLHQLVRHIWLEDDNAHGLIEWVTES